jgi:hypothetical protein
MVYTRDAMMSKEIDFIVKKKKHKTIKIKLLLEISTKYM